MTFSDQEFKQLFIKEYKHWEIYLHKNQYYLGRTYLWAKREDAIDLMSITPEEREELFLIGKELKAALGVLFQPDLMNYIVQGNVSNHLHMHVVPRYASSRTFNNKKFTDERWGKNYAPYDYEFTTPQETLNNIRDALRGEMEQQS